MARKISNKIALLSSNSKILVIGDVLKEINDTLTMYFKDIEYLDLNNESIELLNDTYYEQFNIIIFSFTKKDFSLYSSNFNKVPTNSICLIDDSFYLDYKEYLNSSFATLIKPFDSDSFFEKVYALLSLLEVENILKTKQKVIHRYQSEDVNNEIDTFLDKYSGEIMFINDDLNESLSRLKDLEISKDIFAKISSSLVNLSNVMKMNENLEHLSSLFLEFSQFLDSLVLEEIEPSRYSAFDYLTKIIEDLIIYIDELFVYRLFKDVRVFEDSMLNNIYFLEAQLFGVTEDEESDNLEFF